MRYVSTSGVFVGFRFHHISLDHGYTSGLPYYCPFHFSLHSILSVVFRFAARLVLLLKLNQNHILFSLVLAKKYFFIWYIFRGKVFIFSIIC